MKYIDVHAHLNFPDYNKDREEVLMRTREAGVVVINVGTGAKTSREVVALAEKENNCYAIVGIHPKHDEDTDFETITKLAGHKKVVGIGECGLDYFVRKGEAEVTESDKAAQKEIFKKHIELAIQHNKPLMLHIRSAYGDALEMLREYKIKAGDKLRGNAHFFAGTIAEAQAFLDLGFTLSFTGVITFAKEYEALVKAIPLDRIFSETDAPYVSPVPYRGSRNEPTYVIEVVKKLAEIKGLPETEVAAAIMANARNMFDIA